MDTYLTRSNNILLIGKRSSSTILLSNDLISQIISLNNISKQYTFTNTCTEADLTNIFEKQKNEKLKQQICEPILLYLNDCINAEIGSSEIFKNLILKGRHLNIYVVLFFQYPIDFPPEIRTNFDLVFICKEGMHTIFTKIYNDYFSFIPTFEEFNRLIENLKKDEFLYSKDNKISNYSIVTTV